METLVGRSLRDKREAEKREVEERRSGGAEERSRVI